MIHEWAFKNCAGLRHICTPEGLKEIRKSVFDGCVNLEDVYLSDGLMVIGPYDFSNCTGLKSIRIPASVTEIGESAFSGCPGLKEVIYAGTEEEWEKIRIGRWNELLLSARKTAGQPLIPSA